MSDSDAAFAAELAASRARTAELELRASIRAANIHGPIRCTIWQEPQRYSKLSELIMARTGRASSHRLYPRSLAPHRELFAVHGFAVLFCLFCTSVLQLPCCTGAAAAMIDTVAPAHCEAGGGNWDAGSGHCICSPPLRCMGHVCARGKYGDIAKTGWKPSVCPGCSCGGSAPPPPPGGIDSDKAGKAVVAPVVDCGRVDLLFNHTRQPWCGGHSVPPIWFTYFVDLINDPEAAARYDTLAKNVRHTVDLHPGLNARFLLDDDCLTMLSEVDALLNVSLAAIFRAERDGSFRGDICRAAALHLHGGFYFDLDLSLLLDVRTVLPAGTTFVAAKTEKNGYLFNAIIGATPNHVVIRQYLIGMQRYYGGNKTMHSIAQAGVGWKHGKRARYPGDMMLSAFDEALDTRPASETAKYHLVHEGRFDAHVKNYVPQAGKGPVCDYAVSDWPTQQTVAYSRVVGASKMCNFNDTRTLSHASIEYKAPRKPLSSGPLAGAS